MLVSLYLRNHLFILSNCTLHVALLPFSFLSLYLQLYIEALCHGNLLEEEAMNISNIFKSNSSLQPLPVTMRHEECVMCLPSSANLVRDVNVKNKSETNSVVEVIEN